MRKLAWITAYVTAFLLGAFVGGPAIVRATTGDGGYLDVHWDDSVGTESADLAYGDATAQTYDLYTPAGPKRDAYGLVVFIHGGGFTGGDKAEGATISKWAVSKGYVAASLNYTLYKDDGSGASILEMSEEIKSAIDTVVREADSAGYSIDSMSIGGASAGSMLAMIYGFRDAGSAPVPVKFIFEENGPTLTDPIDLGYSTGYETDEGVRSALDFLNGLVGLDVTAADLRDGTFKDEIRQVSPALLVNMQSPPIVFAHGVQDRVVPYSQSVVLRDALKAANADFTFYRFEKAGHYLGWERSRYVQYLKAVSQKLDDLMPITR